MVVLDFQWLVDVFKKIIVVKFYIFKGGEFEVFWFDFERIGVFYKRVIEFEWIFFCNFEDIFESFFKIMEKFSLICFWFVMSFNE